ncbi:hypothetical protein FRC20_002262 [Serendipita sp. 405]|nr:hypothetical protein FRC20_002262 [Serendipita sp. 405]
MVHYSNLPDDILRYLCQTMRMEKLHGLMNLSGVDRRTREIALPFVFNQIFVPRPSEDQRSWVGFEKTINVILANQTIVSSVRNLDVYLYDAYSEFEEKLPRAFFTLLFSFPKISSLSICLHDMYCSQIREELGDENDSDTSRTLFPPSLNSLAIPDRKWMFLTRYMLQLESLVIESLTQRNPPSFNKDDIQQLGIKHPGLKKFYCQELCVTERVLAIARSLPNLQEIGLRGGIGRHPSNSVMDHLSCYRMLPKLKRISFPWVSFLGVGFYPPCGNAYFNNPGLRVRLAAKAKEVTEQLLEGIQREVMAPGGPCLQTVVVGETVYAYGSNGRFQKSRIIRRIGRDRRTIVEEDIENSGDEDD